MEVNAQNIKDLREKLGVSQVAFGKQIGVSWMTVLRWEKGRHLPKGEAVLRILEELNKSTNSENS